MGRILLAERDEMLRRMIAAAMRASGHEIDVFHDAGEALGHLQTERYDCLLVGAPLPLRSADPPITMLEMLEQRIPSILPRTIVLTARITDAVLLARAARQKVFAVISEPFELTDLRAAVECCCSGESLPSRFVGFSEKALKDVLGPGTP